MLLSFFRRFDWSVGKIQWFLHFNKIRAYEYLISALIHSANNELYIKLRTQVTSRVPYCCVQDKTFTSLNIVKHVERTFENLYTVRGCIFKQQEEL